MRWLLLSAALLSSGAEARRPLRAKLKGKIGLTETQRQSPETALLSATGLLIRQRARLAAASLREGRELFNDAPGLAPALGIACGGLGDLGCVAEATDSEHATGALAHLDIRARANALRWLDRGDEAAQVRRQLLLVPSVTDEQFSYLWSDIAEDYRSAGDAEGLWEAMAHAEAAAPDSPHVYALQMELALDAGDLDEALFVSFLANRDKRNSIEMEEARMRLSLALDAPEDTLLNGAADYTLGRLKPTYAVRLLETYRRAGWHALTRDLIGRNLWLVDGEVWWPQVLSIMALIYLDHGEVDKAQDALDRAVEIAPTNPVVHEAVAVCADQLTPRPFGTPAPHGSPRETVAQ